MDQFFTRLRQLAGNCGFTDGTVKDEIKSQIIQGCASSTLRKKALRDNWSLDKIIESAKATELADKHTTLMENKANDSSVNKVRDARQQTHTKQHVSYNKQRRARGESQQHRTCRNCGNGFPHVNESCPAATRKCYKCRKIGHFAKYCLSAKSRPQQHKQPANAIDTTPKHTHSSDTDQDYSFAVNKPGEKIPCVKMSVNDVEINFLIDSGASVNVID